MLGDTTVGKTSLINRFVENDFRLKVEPTLGGMYNTRCAAIFAICNPPASGRPSIGQRLQSAC